jgi:hypothetical protein
MSNVMLDSERYRSHIAECLNAADAASDPHYRKLAVFMAASWLKIATQEDAVSKLLTSWGIAPAPE